MRTQNKDGALDVSELGLLMDPRHYIHSLNEVRYFLCYFVVKRHHVSSACVLPISLLLAQGYQIVLRCDSNGDHELSQSEVEGCAATLATSR